MDATEVHTLLEDLSGNLDDLEESLAPLLKASLASTTSRIPLLDKAKLYVLATYAIESILFSYLRLNGVDAKEHAVFRELTRVKEYFEKIKTAESGPSKPSTSLDKAAAARFIKQGLAGNDGYDQERRSREQHAAKRKADFEATSQWGTHNRFEGTAKRIRAQEMMVPVVKASEADDEDVEMAGTETSMSKEEKKAAKRQRRLEARLAKQSPVSNTVPETSEPATKNEGPRGTRDTFQALLQGPILESDQKAKKKKKRKSRGEYRQELEDQRAQEMM